MQSCQIERHRVRHFNDLHCLKASSGAFKRKTEFLKGLKAVAGAKVGGHERLSRSALAVLAFLIFSGLYASCCRRNVGNELPLSVSIRAEDVQRTINRLAFLVALVSETFDAKCSNECLNELLRQALRAAICCKAVEAADKMSEKITDAALREVGAALLTDLVQKRDLEHGHLHIIAYGQKVADRPPLKRKRGRYGTYDRWRQNLSVRACPAGVRPIWRQGDGSRQQRADHEPSGISLTVAAYARNRIHLHEATVQNEIWFGI
jgi:hypothetical protein